MANLGSLMFQVGADTSQLRRAEGEVKRSAGAMEQSLISVGSAAKLAIGAFAANELRKFMSDVTTTGMKLQQLSLSFKAITGSTEAANNEMLFIKATANTMGQSFVTVADAYKGIAAAAKGTSLEGKATRDIFEAVSGASTVLGLTAEQTGRSLYALSQMISKGKVSSEELRQQLGENLPGAFNIAADAMGVTTQEFDKMLQEGKVMTEDFLPKFAAAMQEKFGRSVTDSAKSAQAATNRLANAFTELQDAVWKKGESSYTAFVSWTAEVVNSTAGVISSFGESEQAVNRFGKSVSESSKENEYWTGSSEDSRKALGDLGNKIAETTKGVWDYIKSLELIPPSVTTVITAVYESVTSEGNYEMSVPKGRQQLYASRQRRRIEEEVAAGRVGLSPYQIDPEMARAAGQKMAGKWGPSEKEAASKAALKSYEKYGLTPGERAAKQASEAKQNMEAAGWIPSEVEKVQQGIWNEFYGAGKKSGGGKKGSGKNEVWESWNKTMEEGKDIIEDSFTATEKYNSELDKLKWYLDYGAISQDEYGKAVQATWEDLVKANEASEGWKGHLQVLKDSESLFKDTRTAAEKYAEEIERLNYLLAYNGPAFQDTYNRGIIKAKEEFEKTTDKMSEFAIQAARNIESSLGDTLYNVLKGNFDNIGTAFGDMLLKMMSQAEAAEIGSALFGDFGQSKKIGGLFGWLADSVKGGGGSSSSGFGIAEGWSMLGLASGGPVRAGNAYLVGERGPEIFAPRSSGTIIPNSDIGGGSSSQPPSINVNIVNETGQKVGVDQGEMSFDGASYHVNMSIKLLKNNVGGYRDTMKSLLSGR